MRADTTQSRSAAAPYASFSFRDASFKYFVGTGRYKIVTSDRCRVSVLFQLPIDHVVAARSP